MALIVYGIPNMIQASHLFLLNDGEATVRIDFKNGIIDPSAGKPATFKTENEALVGIIEDSPLFGREIFCYDAKGKKYVPKREARAAAPADKKVGRKKAEPAPKPELPSDKTFPEVTTIGQAAEKLLELGATAEQLRGNDGIIDTMLEFGVVFPNLSMR